MINLFVFCNVIVGSCAAYIAVTSLIEEQRLKTVKHIKEEKRKYRASLNKRQ